MELTAPSDEEMWIVVVADLTAPAAVDIAFDAAVAVTGAFDVTLALSEPVNEFTGVDFHVTICTVRRVIQYGALQMDRRYPAGRGMRSSHVVPWTNAPMFVVEWWQQVKEDRYEAIDNALLWSGRVGLPWWRT